MTKNTTECSNNLPTLLLIGVNLKHINIGDLGLGLTNVGKLLFDLLFKLFTLLFPLLPLSFFFPLLLSVGLLLHHLLFGFLDLLLSVDLVIDSLLVLGLLFFGKLLKHQRGHAILHIEILKELECFVMEPWDNVIVKHLSLEGVGVETFINKSFKCVLLESVKILASQ